MLSRLRDKFIKYLQTFQTMDLNSNRLSSDVVDKLSEGINDSSVITSSDLTSLDSILDNEHDARKPILKTFNYGYFEISYFMNSYGDVFEQYIQDEKLGLMLADTIGHSEIYGNRFKEFAKNKLIPHSDSSCEFVKECMIGLNDKNNGFTDDMSYIVALGYLNLLPHNESCDFEFTNSGLVDPVIVSSTGMVEELPTMGNISSGAYGVKLINNPNYEIKLNTFYGKLDIGDTLILRTDGLHENIEGSTGNEFSLSEFSSVANTNTNNALSSLINKYSSELYGNSSYDDVSIIYIKRINDKILQLPVSESVESDIAINYTTNSA